VSQWFICLNTQKGADILNLIVTQLPLQQRRQSGRRGWAKRANQLVGVKVKMFSIHLSGLPENLSSRNVNYY
jgi:hypothetical protein